MPRPSPRVSGGGYRLTGFGYLPTRERPRNRAGYAACARRSSNMAAGPAGRLVGPSRAEQRFGRCSFCQLPQRWVWLEQVERCSWPVPAAGPEWLLSGDPPASVGARHARVRDRAPVVRDREVIPDVRHDQRKFVRTARRCRAIEIQAGPTPSRLRPRCESSSQDTDPGCRLRG